MKHLLFQVNIVMGPRGFDKKKNNLLDFQFNGSHSIQVDISFGALWNPATPPNKIDG